MKHVMIAIILVAGLLGSASMLSAQSAIKTMGSFNNVIVDTSMIFAYTATLKPGETTDMHTHSAHLLYILEGGKIEVRFADGNKEVHELEAGFSGFFPPEAAHVSANVGNTTVKFLLVELPEYPYKPKKAK